ncbi:hypothetical protein [Propionispora vibrioides]|uniref:DUF4878 domain-containing protein n=1 Tax=Propionispora vibrioides TaxID=112903 RepID=A0A1H8VPC5_9FIRM|nr:hypothetical protein [Propionispora vibrioides]SEP17133.1 hypothetical protein SAMN04490178_11244 [Propionispora vibrioides]
MKTMHTKARALAVCALVLFMFALAGCGGGSSNLKRESGLSATGVVDTFYSLAKANKIDEAGLYVSSSSKSSAQAVKQFISDNGDLSQIKKSNLLSIKQAAAQGNYAVVVATLQEQGTLRITVKPVGLEKVNGEWYIVDFNQIYQNAKYQVLQQLLENVNL